MQNLCFFIIELKIKSKIIRIFTRKKVRSKLREKIQDPAVKTKLRKSNLVTGHVSEIHQAAIFNSRSRKFKIPDF